MIAFKQKITALSLIIALALLPLGACKDTKATHEAGLLETCKALSDESNWGEAITECEKVAGDEGKHLAAQAYMGNAGLSLFSIITGLGTASNPMTLILSKIPDTEAKADDYNRALQIIMDEITVKTNTMYLEALLLSSMLVYKELAALFELTVVDGEITNCASSGTLENCSFSFTIAETAGYATGLAFAGLGTTIYDGICQNRDLKATSIATTEVLNHVVGNTVVSLSVPIDITHNMTINGCTIAAKSPMAYNKAAGENLSGFDDLAASLAKLKIYAEIDKGNNFEQSATDMQNKVKLCNTGFIEPPVASDGILNDCEVLGYLNPPAAP